jgi:soluble lytic murein transglycosylase-like protein
VRIGKPNSSEHQGRGLQPGRLAQWSRKLVSVLALAASVAAFALIVESQHGQLLFGEPLHGTPGPFSPAGGAQGRDAAVLNPTEETRYRALSEFVAKRYRVSQDVAFDLVTLAHQEGNRLQLDPLLIIAVIAIESRFNPIAESVAGAKGLMQIIPKYHTDKLDEFGGEQAVFDPATNIQVGSRILREYIRHTGNVGIALQMYAGALGDSEDQYTNKVLNERRRLQQVVPSTATARALTPGA